MAEERRKASRRYWRGGVDTWKTGRPWHDAQAPGEEERPERDGATGNLAGTSGSMPQELRDTLERWRKDWQEEDVTDVTCRLSSKGAKMKQTQTLRVLNRMAQERQERIDRKKALNQGGRPADPGDSPDMRALLDAMAKESEESLWRDIEAWTRALEATEEAARQTAAEKDRRGGSS